MMTRTKHTSIKSIHHLKMIHALHVKMEDNPPILRGTWGGIVVGMICVVRVQQWVRTERVTVIVTATTAAVTERVAVAVTVTVIVTALMIAVTTATTDVTVAVAAHLHLVQTAEAISATINN